MKLKDSIPCTGNWNGYFLEQHRPEKGWMHLYLTFAKGQILGEGIDYVGPWTINGTWDQQQKFARWEKRYLKQHTVQYFGELHDHGIVGTWKIGNYLAGRFAIWPEHEDEIDLGNSR
jgi:hypothetical protein